MSRSFLAKALGSFLAPRAKESQNPAGASEVARTWGQRNVACRIQDPHDRAVPGRTGQAEVVWQPEPKKEVLMTGWDFEAIFPARRKLSGD